MAEVILPRLFAQLFAAQHLASAATKIRISPGNQEDIQCGGCKQLVFWSILSLSMFMIAIRANADGLSFEESLIGYDDRGTLQLQNNAQAQPCQSCPPGTNCQSCVTDETCTCNSADHQCGSSPAPMILNIGPPPKLYSPASDFGARFAAKPSGLAVVGDEGAAAMTIQAAGPTSTIYTAAPCAALISYPSPAPNAAMAVYMAPIPAPAFAAAGFPAPGMPAMAQPPCVPELGCSGYPPASFVPPATMYYVPAIPGSNSVTGTTAGQLDHMLQAIHHLEAAGLQAEADRLRGLCDAQMHEAVNQLRSAEAELLQLRETATAETSAVRANHPLQPVVTAALVPVPNSATHYYPVQQAGYISPSETLTQPAHQDDSFDQTTSPLPFSPQLISVGPLQGFGFGEFSNTWKTSPEVELPTIPWILEGSLSTPDYR